MKESGKQVCNLAQHSASRHALPRASAPPSLWPTCPPLPSFHAGNFQQLLTDQASFYNNLLKSFSSSNATVAARTVCELGALYQALPSLLTSSSNPYAALLSSSAGSSMTNALSSLLSDSAYARVFNQECR